MLRNLLKLSGYEDRCSYEYVADNRTIIEIEAYKKGRNVQPEMSHQPVSATF